MANLDVLTYGFTFVSDQGYLGYSTVSLLQVDSRRILIDTGPSSRRGLLREALESRGLGFDDIDTVVLTHLHWDHCNNADLFPNARVLVHPKELDYARRPSLADEKMLDSSRVFYPGHDRPFRLDGQEISYLEGPTQIEFTTTNEGGAAPALVYRVLARREPNIDTVQKG